MAVSIWRMTSDPPPGFKRVSDWKDKRVRVLRELKNHYFTIPAGTLATVDRVGGGVGLSLLCDPCKCCGVQASISRISTDFVELCE